jgi:hypothetical protein
MRERDARADHGSRVARSSRCFRPHRRCDSIACSGWVGLGMDLLFVLLGLLLLAFPIIAMSEISPRISKCIS